MIRLTTLVGTTSLIACCFWLGCDAPEIEKAPAGSFSVTVTIDFKGRKQNKEFQVSASDNSTVESVLGQAQNAGEIAFSARGEGETAFVTAIDGVENEKGAGDNWTYRVNGKLGDRSCGVFKVKRQDQILWEFGKYP